MRNARTRRFWLRVGLAAAAVVLLAGSTSVVSAATAPPAAVPAVSASPLAGTFVPLPPTRIADSRITMSFPTLRALETDDLQLVGRGGIPMTGVAAGVLNVTVADSQHGGYLTVWPSGRSRPDSSNVNFGGGRAVANMVIVPVDNPMSGTISIYNGSHGSTDVLVDVQGYIRS